MVINTATVTRSRSRRPAVGTVKRYAPAAPPAPKPMPAWLMRAIIVAVLG